MLVKMAANTPSQVDALRLERIAGLSSFDGRFTGSSVSDTIRFFIISGAGGDRISILAYCTAKFLANQDKPELRYGGRSRCFL
jgi:hypothetical protein